MSIVVDDELSTATGTDETTTPAATGDESNFEMPEKFAGKSADEIIKSYTELEKELGRKNNEVGELRKLTDQYLHQELSRSTSEADPKTESPSSIDFDDLMEKPEDVISSVVRKELEQVNQRFDQLNTEQRMNKFMSDNPDYNEISNSKEFYDWVQESPMRARTLSEAQTGDFDAADAILAEYRKQGELQQQREELAKAKQDKALSDASVETAGTGASTNRTFNRRELMDMYINKPDEYKALLPEIEKAYAEGRIKN